MTNKRIIELTKKRTKVGLLTKIYNQPSVGEGMLMKFGVSSD